jgi:hypothetical protein
MLRSLACALVLGSLVSLGSSCKSSDNDHEMMMKANSTCPLDGQPVDHMTYYDYNGTKIYTCCAGCAERVKADPKMAMAKAYPPK